MSDTEGMQKLLAEYKSNSDDLLLSIGALVMRVAQLEAGIREHRDAKGQDRCKLNNIKLYELLGEPIPDPEMPCKEAWMEGCEKYYEEEVRKG